MASIEARFILEIMGRPPEHIVKTLNEIIARIESEKGVKLINKKVHEPVLIKDSKDLYTTFAELEFEFDSLNMFWGILFAYMPSNVELIAPERLTLSNQELSLAGTQILNKLHFYEAVVKRLVAERDTLKNQLQQISDAPSSKKPTTKTHSSKGKKAPKKR